MFVTIFTVINLLVFPLSAFIMRVILLALYLFLNFIHIKAEDKDELAGKIFIEKIDRVTAQLKNKATLADWDYQSNITDANLAKQVSK